MDGVFLPLDYDPTYRAVVDEEDEDVEGFDEEDDDLEEDDEDDPDDE